MVYRDKQKLFEINLAITVVCITCGNENIYSFTTWEILTQERSLCATRTHRSRRLKKEEKKPLWHKSGSLLNELTLNLDHKLVSNSKVTYRNGDVVNVNDTERYEGGNSENVALVIRSTDKQDIGNYSCQLANVIGKGISEQQIDLDVQFVPIVEVLMIPEGPVKENANPSVLTKVRWYANSTLLKELPDCEETREDLCHIDPSKLLLESIGRGFFYNYSCEGYNAAGWGTRSDDKELLVHYEPGPAVVTHFPLIAVKKKSVTFSCSVDDPGYPESNRFQQQQKQQKQQQEPHADNSQLKPKHVLKETHALIDLTNNSFCTLLTLTTFSPQSQILTLLTTTTTTTTTTTFNNNKRYHHHPRQHTSHAAHNNEKYAATATGAVANVGGGVATTMQPTTSTLSLYRKMGKFSFVAQTVMPSFRYRWLRGGRGPLQDVVTKDWTVEPVGLDSRTNYSCYAFNEGGKGVMATVNLEVHAPPFFIKNLPPYTGMLHTSRNANLTCRIECVPRCEISWLKDGVPIDKNDTRYFVKDKYMDASPATGDFESMLSVLHFNMSNWPNKKFDIEGDNANYTCVSTGNTVGPGIKSATYFSIECKF
uniref:Ig-like domain-containing protein n=1 Tax=Glossina austeni TaxID=7395 RepID=A0A1A9VWA8_GLOAU